MGKSFTTSEILLAPSLSGLIFQIHRTTCLTVSYVISGILGLLYFAVPVEEAAGRVVIFIMCQAMLIASFYMVGTYIQDIFSTDIRHSTFNLLDSFSKIGTVFAPFVVQLGQPGSGLPLGIFGICMIVAGMVFLILPETKGLPLMQNYRDMDKQSDASLTLVGRLIKRCK